MTEGAPEEDIIEAAWQKLLTAHRVDGRLLRAAYAEPRLRQLFPWVGMGELHFSRCTELRWTWDVPFVAPMMGGGFLVGGPSRSQSVGPAPTAEAAIAMVVERLPPGCGRAFVGTPEELAEKEQAEQ
ncbi:MULTISPECIES: DUF6193 family natural product biosynthesis protein [unclassified Streptomyces]|uniref:DUF6193 family natural product biosynthesis protein n=1 Tax=unclassified Streptomyces TaxID=2593676 RepID=UPI0003A46D86|nr:MULTISPECIES: DUF6193 family natural product biosynthesis protein [unclassified Streptomyces]